MLQTSHLDLKFLCEIDDDKTTLPYKSYKLRFYNLVAMKKTSLNY